VTRSSCSTPAIRLKATDDRALRAVVLFDPNQDTVIGGAELTGRSQSLDFTLTRGVPGPGGDRSEKTLFRLLTLLADGGGNIARIETSAPSR
jgi:hypothetical protein